MEATEQNRRESLTRGLSRTVHAELIALLRRRAAVRGLVPGISQFASGGLAVRPQPVVHTNHPTLGYEIECGGYRVVWAPEFWVFPGWSAGAGPRLSRGRRL